MSYVAMSGPVEDAFSFFQSAAKTVQTTATNVANAATGVATTAGKAAAATPKLPTTAPKAGTLVSRTGVATTQVRLPALPSSNFVTPPPAAPPSEGLSTGVKVGLAVLGIGALLLLKSKRRSNPSSWEDAADARLAAAVAKGRITPEQAAQLRGRRGARMEASKARRQQSKDVDAIMRLLRKQPEDAFWAMRRR